VRASVYPPIDQWRVPRAAVTATLASVVGAGRRGDEAGVFWLGSRDLVTDMAAVVSLRGPGVLESPGLWQVSSQVYGVVTRLAQGMGLVLVATAHTHGRGVPVRLSPTDRRHGVRVPDFLALVIGEGGDAPKPTDWSWNTYEIGDFRRLDGAEMSRRVHFVDGAVACFRANAHGATNWPGNADD
jgi:hypothetical protein